MFTIIKFTFSFLISFIILSFPVGETPLFEILHRVSSPYISPIYDITINYGQKGVKEVTKYSKKAFTNSGITSNQFDQDKINTITSAAKKTSSQKLEEVETFLEEKRNKMTQEEKEKIRQVLLRSLE